jgi:hypothetical protein
MTLQDAMDEFAGDSYGPKQPPGIWKAGKYTGQTPEGPKTFFVKKGLVHDQHDPVSATVRHEYATQRIFDIMANKSNGVLRVNNTLHSNEHNGAPVPADFRWPHESAGYLVAHKFRRQNSPTFLKKSVNLFTPNLSKAI